MAERLSGILIFGVAQKIHCTEESSLRAGLWRPRAGDFSFGFPSSLTGAAEDKRGRSAGRARRNRFGVLIRHRSFILLLSVIK